MAPKSNGEFKGQIKRGLKTRSGVRSKVRDQRSSQNEVKGLRNMVRGTTTERWLSLGCSI